MRRSLAGTLILLVGLARYPNRVLAQAIHVGQGSPNPQIFVDAYNRRGGLPSFGLPINPAHRWGPGWTQDFRGGRAGDTAIMLADGAGTAHVLHGEIWKKYRDGGGVDRCGYPTSDEMGGASSRGTQHALVTTPQCLIYYLTGGSQVGRTFWTWGLITQKFRSVGAHGGVLGLPISDEQDGATSPYGTPGRFQRFENGSIEFARGGRQPMTPFVVRGDTYQKYAELGFSGSWLGWPIGDEAPTGDRFRQNFEGGYITWDPVIRAVAHRPEAAGGHPAPAPPSLDRPRLPQVGLRFRYPLGGGSEKPFTSVEFGRPGVRMGHLGEDYPAPFGTPVRAAASGVVIAVVDREEHRQYRSFGYTVVIRHDDPTVPGGAIYSQYSHLSRVMVRRGTTVEIGTAIGATGSTGESTGNHLHFEIKTSGDFGRGYAGVHFNGNTWSDRGITYYRPSWFIESRR